MFLLEWVRLASKILLISYLHTLHCMNHLIDLIRVVNHKKFTFRLAPSDFLQDALAELGRISSEALQLLRTVRALGAEDRLTSCDGWINSQSYFHQKLGMKLFLGGLSIHRWNFWISYWRWDEFIPQYREFRPWHIWKDKFLQVFSFFVLEFLMTITQDQSKFYAV